MYWRGSSFSEPFHLRKEEAAFYLSIRIAIASVNSVRFNAFCKKITNGPRRSFCRISSTDELTEIFNGISLFKNNSHDRSGGHILDKVIIKWSFLMHCVKSACLLS